MSEWQGVEKHIKKRINTILTFPWNYKLPFFPEHNPTTTEKKNSEVDGDLFIFLSNCFKMMMAGCQLKIIERSIINGGDREEEWWVLKEDRWWRIIECTMMKLIEKIR